MTDRNRWDEQRREQGQDYRSGQQSGWDENWRDRQQHQRDMSGRSGNSASRPWGGSSSTQQGGSHDYEDYRDRDQRGSGAMGGASGYGWSEQGDADRGTGSRDWARTRDWGGSDWGGEDRGGTDWRSRDNWRNAGSQSFASDYGMRDGQNYDERFRRQGFGGSGAYSNPGFGRGYGPDYGRDHDDGDYRDRNRQGQDARSGGRSERGFFERAGDEIAGAVIDGRGLGQESGRGVPFRCFCLRRRTRSRLSRRTTWRAVESPRAAWASYLTVKEKCR